MSKNVESLRSVVLFQDLNDQALEALASLLEPKKLRAGQVIFREHDEADQLYIVAEGRVIVSKHITGDVDHVLTRFGPGEFFGEMGLFDSAPRSASAQTEEDSTLLTLGRDLFRKIVTEYPEMAAPICYRMVIVFIQRLRATNEQAREAVRWGLEATGYSALEES
jgi:CRP-like cAMP-binding protein